MEDNRIDVLERLAAADPAPQAQEFDQARADRVLAGILAERRREPRSRLRRKRFLVPALALVVIGIAAPALAFDGVRSFIGLHREGFEPILEESELLASAPVVDGTVVRLWRAPNKSGGECLFETYGPPGDLEHPPERGGGMCKWGPGASYEQAARAGGESIVVNHGAAKRPLKVHGATEWVPPVFWGWIDPALGATQVEIRWTGGSKQLAVDNDFFIGAVEEIYEPVETALPFFLVAYDSEGQEVGRRKLEPVRLD